MKRGEAERQMKAGCGDNGSYRDEEQREERRKDL
jgi:hypothetical protein